MIIYDKRKPKTFDGANCVGITGENLAETQEFLIRGMCDITVDYTIHLRFADGSVNSVIPDSTAIDETGTKLVWKVRKNDIFMHGYFELQLEGRGENGYVFQTQIVTLYADESIPIEDKEYLNPNSETLKLREETQKLLDETKLCRTEIDKTKKLIEQSDITKKEDNSNKVSDSSQITDYTQNYPSIKYLTNNYWDSADSYSSDEVDTLLNAKADNKSLNVTNKIKSASCMYKTIGDVVIVSATVKMNAVSLAGNSMCPLIDLPYKCISEDNVFCVGISNLGKLFKFAIPKNNTWLQFSTQDKTAYTFADGEQINVICLYKIK